MTYVQSLIGAVCRLVIIRLKKVLSNNVEVPVHLDLRQAQTRDKVSNASNVGLQN